MGFESKFAVNAKKLLRESLGALSTQIELKRAVSGYPYCYLCSFQKSGRTWLRFILGNYLNIKFELGLNLNFHNIYSVIPSLTENKRVTEAYGLLVRHNINIPLILASHLNYNPFLFRNARILFMMRSVYDTMVSFYFHNATHHQRYEKGIQSFIKEPRLGVMRWINYMNSWSPRLVSGNCSVITYESLNDQPVDSVHNVLSFLNMPIDKAIIRESLDLSSFDKMQEIEIESGIVDHDYDRSDDEARRMRKGEIGAHVNYLDNEDIQYIKQHCEINLNKKSKELLLRNGIAF